jgi:S1-C subfamily serine protease
MGIGFAIPINMAKEIMTKLIDKGRVERGWLGVSIQDLTNDLAQSFKFEGTEGVLVGDVAKGGPADKAGLKAGDIVVSFGGKKMTSVDHLRNAVAEAAPGTKGELEVFRDGKTLKLGVEVGQMEDQPKPVAGGEKATSEGLGITVETLTPERARRLNLESNTIGVLITRVAVGSIASRAGLKEGLVITQVDAERVETAQEFQAAMGRHALKDGIRLQVRSHDMLGFVYLKG